MFYREVVQAVLIFGAKTWVLLESMSQNMEGLHVGFLKHITGQQTKQQRDGTWRREAAAKVLKESGNQPLGAYIDKWQATVAEWVV